MNHIYVDTHYLSNEFVGGKCQMLLRLQSLTWAP
jgi:hypothetical protein